MNATVTSRKMPSAHAHAFKRRVDDPSVDLGAPPVLIDVSRIQPHPDNPRDDFSDDDPELLALVESLKTVKLIQAIHVEEIDHDSERYRVIAGERRWRAAKLAGWKTIPAIVCRLDRATTLTLMVEENLQRKNLNLIEQARAVELLTRPI